MMRPAIVLFLLAISARVVAADAAVVLTPRGVVIATANRIHLGDAWNVAGVAHPTAIASSAESVVVLDALRDEAVIVGLASGEARRIRTAATPIAALFTTRDIYLLARDAAVLQRVGGANIPLAADPAFARTLGDRVYVYSRRTGILQEIVAERVVRQVSIAPFASDFEIDGSTGYFVDPRAARIRMIDLVSLQPAGELAVGAVPVDLAISGGGTALTARVLAAADPSARRVWLTEGRQSVMQAFGRGFLRGLLGLGFFNRSAQFPTGVDRILAAGTRRIAYDSTTGSLYQLTGRGGQLLATGISPSAFAISDEAIVWWNGERLVTVRDCAGSAAFRLHIGPVQ